MEKMVTFARSTDFINDRIQSAHEREQTIITKLSNATNPC